MPFDIAEREKVVAVYANPFSLAKPKVLSIQPGLTLAEIIGRMPFLPDDFAERGTVCINGNEIQKGAWHLVRPKTSSELKPISVTFHLAPQGGKTGKSIIAVVALLALAVLTAGIGNGLLAPVLGAGFAAGTTGATILAASVQLAGALAIAALTATPQKKQQDEQGLEQKEAASASGNVIQPNGAVPRVVGTRKTYPPLICQPIVERVGGDEYVETVCVLNGPHEITDVLVGDASIDDNDNIEYNVYNGWDDDADLSLVTRYGYVENGVQLSGYEQQKNDNVATANKNHPDQSIARFHRFATKRGPDEVWIHIDMPAGLSYPAATDFFVAMPFRLRIRRRGDVLWRNIPEIHFIGKQSVPIRGQVILHFGESAPGSIPQMTGSAGWYYANKNVPAQTVAPTGVGAWQADNYFSNGAGSDALYAGKEATSNVANISFDDNDDPADYNKNANSNTCHVWLSDAEFPKDIYEIDIKRGLAYTNGYINLDSYTRGGIVYNLFGWWNTTTPQYISNNSVLTAISSVARVVSVFNSSPMPEKGFAAIEVRAKNISLQSISCTASGYTKDWNGTGWDDYVITSNPAPHFRDMLMGRLNLDPLPEELLDEQKILEWRSHCARNDYTCDAIIDGQRISEALDLICGCGYARPYYSDLWGVIMDYDRSAESPIQVFSARNSKSFKIRKGFPRLPTGFRVSYRDNDADASTQQIIVSRDGQPVSDYSRLEQIAYEGILDETKIRSRAEFDLRQGELRMTFYSLESPAEAIVCRRGSLVAVQHDVLTRHAGAARVLDTVVSSSLITDIVLDDDVLVINEDDMLDDADILAVDDMLNVGISMGASIRNSDNSITTHPISNTTGYTDTLTLTTPIVDVSVTAGPYDDGLPKIVSPGCLVVVGPIGQEYSRFIVSEIAFTRDLNAQLMLVDEAPELWA